MIYFTCLYTYSYTRTCTRAYIPTIRYTRIIYFVFVLTAIIIIKYKFNNCISFFVGNKYNSCLVFLSHYLFF